jgi:YfiR/HmsC-like
MEVLNHSAQSRTPAPVGHRRLLVVAALATLLAKFSPASAVQSYSEDSVKAAYLVRFTQYIDWPPRASAEPFTIAVLNAPGVAAELQRMLPDHPIKNSVARVRVITRVQDLGGAQMLYLGPAPAGRLRSLISSIAFGPVLLVTDSEEGLELGSILNFITVEHRVRFEVSLTAADKSQFRVSSELLAVAAHVRGGARQTDGLRPAAGTAWSR